MHCDNFPNNNCIEFCLSTVWYITIACICSLLPSPSFTLPSPHLAAHAVPFHSTAYTVASAPLPNFTSVNTRFEMIKPRNSELDDVARTLSAIFVN